MLMSISYDVIESLKVNLVFDDNTTKSHEICVNDTIKVTFNKNGQRKTVEGIVKRIFPDGHLPAYPQKNCGCNKSIWNIIIDGSQYGCSAIERVEVTKILDLDIIRKDKLESTITSPIGEDNVTQFRLVGNILQLSKDYGVTWLTVLTLPEQDIIVPKEDEELMEKVESILPSSLRPDLKSDLITDIMNLVKGELESKVNDDTISEDVSEETTTV